MTLPSTRASGLLVFLLVAGGVGFQPVQAWCATGCITDTIGLDPSYSTGSTGALLGEGVGQTFLARDTLIEFLRVWRVASQYQDWYIGMHLYIVETNDLGEPDARRIVLDGPTIVIPDGDGIHPIEFQWTFDPPLALPHGGLYAFFLFQDPCQAHFDVLATNQPSLYADGDFWSTDRSDCRMYSQIGLNYHPEGDMIFQIGLCRDAETASRRRTWGELKLLYR